MLEKIQPSSLSAEQTDGCHARHRRNDELVELYHDALRPDAVQVNEKDLTSPCSMLHHFRCDKGGPNRSSEYTFETIETMTWAS
jgi:hypothetical protein